MRMIRRIGKTKETKEKPKERPQQIESRARYIEE